VYVKCILLPGEIMGTELGNISKQVFDAQIKKPSADQELSADQKLYQDVDIQKEVENIFDYAKKDKDKTTLSPKEVKNWISKTHDKNGTLSTNQQQALKLVTKTMRYVGSWEQPVLLASSEGEKRLARALENGFAKDFISGVNSDSPQLDRMSCAIQTTVNAINRIFKNDPNAELPSTNARAIDC